VRRRIYFAGVAAALVAGATVLGATASGSTASGAGARPERQVVMAHGDDRLPSVTATDWVTYADHVVVVTAASERISEPAQTDLQRGEGLLGRTVRLQVEDVLWSRDGAPQPAPESWDYSAAGSVFTDGAVAEPVPMALHDRPRVEVGHRYIMAIVWERARCSPGDAPEPARWMGLGEGSELPFDGGVIGQGELEGTTRTATQARALAAEPAADRGLEEELAGGGARALAERLKTTKPGVRAPSAAQAIATCG
jgi:hypothetical protein